MSTYKSIFSIRRSGVVNAHGHSKIELAIKLQQTIRNTCPSTGAAIVDRYGILRDQVGFPNVAEPRTVTVYLSTNWLASDDDFLDQFRLNCLRLKREGCEVYVVIEVLNPFAHWERMARICFLPTYGGVVENEDLQLVNHRWYVLTSWLRLFGPGPSQFAYSYRQATLDHWATCRDLAEMFTEFSNEGIGLQLSFLDQIDRPLIYALTLDGGGVLTEVLAEGSFAYGDKDLENRGILTTDGAFIESRQTDRLARQASHKASTLLERMKKHGALDAALAEVNLPIHGIRDPNSSNWQMHP